MKLKELSGLFSSQIDAQGKLKLRKISQCDDLCQYFSQDEALILERVKTNVSGDDLIVTGYTKIFKSKQALNVSLKIHVKSTQINLSLTGDLPSSWSLSDGFGPFPKSWRKTPEGFLKMSDSLLGDVKILNPSFIVTNFIDADQGLSKGINFKGLLVPSEALGALQLWIAKKERLPLQGTIQLNPSLGALVDLRSSLQDSAFPADNLGIRDIQLCILTTSFERQQVYESRLELNGKISTSGDNPVTIELRAVVGDADDTWEFSFIALDNGLTLKSGLSSLASLSGGEIDVSFLNTLPFLKKITLQSIRIGIVPKEMEVRYIGFKVGSTTPWTVIPKIFKITNPKVGLFFRSPFSSKFRSVSTQVEGTFSIGQKNPVDIDMKAEDVDGFRCYGNLQDGDVIPLSDAVSTFTSIQSLPKVDVNRLNFAVDTGGYFAMEAGIDEDWKISLGRGKSFVLQSTWFALQRLNKTYTGAFSSKMKLAGIELSVLGRQETPVGGWDFEGKTKTGQGILLSKVLNDLLEKFGGSFPFSIQKIKLKNLYFRYKTQEKSFEFSGDSLVPGKIPLGPNTHDIQTRITVISSIDTKSKKRTYSGTVEGDLMIGSSQFQIQYELNTRVTKYTGRWTSTDQKTIGINTIAESLGIGSKISIPKGMDLSLKEVIFQYNAKDDYFTLSARSKTYGDAFMTAGMSENKNWGFIFGVNLPEINKLSKIPVIGKQLKPADFLTFEQTSLILASTTFNNYSIPPLPVLPSDSSTSSRAVSVITESTNSAPLQIGAGLSLAAVIDLGKTKNNKVISNLKSLVPQNKFVLQATFGTNRLRLFAGLGGSLKIPTGVTSLTLTNPALLIDLSKGMIVQIQGGMNFSINNCPIKSLSSMNIGQTQAEVTVSVTETKKAFPPPPGIKGLHINNFGLAMGVYFTPPAVALGLQGKFYIGNQKNQLNDFAFILEVMEGVPNPLFFSFNIKHSDFGNLLTLFTNKSSSSIVKMMNIVKGSDLSFYWSESAIALPDGSITQPGFGFSGNIKILNLSGHASLKMDLNQGIEGEAELSPINLRNILKISGSGKGVKNIYEQVNGRWKKVDNKQVLPKDSGVKTREQVIIPPGNAIVKINCLSSPFLVVNWKVSLLGILNQKVDVLISTKGFSFTLAYSVAKVGKLGVNCILNGYNFSASAAFALSVNQKIGPIKIAKINCGNIKLKTNISCGVAIALNVSKFSMGITGKFSFQGLNLSIPKITLSVAPSSMAKLPSMIIRQIEKNSEKIFNQLFKDAGQWAKFVKKGIISDVDDTAKVLKGAYHLASGDAVKMMKGMGKSADEVAKGLKSTYKLSSKSAAKTMKAAKYSADQVSSGLKSGYNLGSKDAAKVMKSAKFSSKEVTKSLKKAYKCSSKSAAKAMKAARFSAKDVNSAVGSVYKLSSKSMKSVLKGAGYTSKQISSGIKSTGKSIKKFFHGL